MKFLWKQFYLDETGQTLSLGVKVFNWLNSKIQELDSQKSSDALESKSTS